jgi:hypothetical protein
VDILGLVDSSGQEHHSKKYHQYGQNNSDDDVRRSPERLKLVKAKRCADKAYNGQKTAERTLHKITSNSRPSWAA